MKNITNNIAVVSTAALLGCSTTFTSTPVDKIKDNYQGVFYALPMLQYDITATRQIRDCDVNLEATGLNIVGKVDITAQFVADPYATFQLDYREMSQPTSTSDLTINLTEDSRLKSINASADDKSVEILTNSFSILSSIALAEAGVPSATERISPANLNELPQCTDEIKMTFAELLKTNDELAILTANVAGLSDEIKRLTLLLLSTETSESVSTELNETGKKLQTATRKLELLTNKRKPFADKLFYIEKKQWPKSSANTFERTNNPEGEMLALEMSKDVLKKWWSNYNASHTNVAGKALLSKVDFAFNLSRMTDTIANKRPNKNSSGVYYRHPVDVQLQVCSGLSCNKNAANIIDKKVHQSPQHGPYVSLPFRNRAFQNTTLNVSFSDNGVPSSVTFKNEQAALAEASSAISNIASQLPALRQQLLGEELESLKLKTALVEQTAKLNTAETSLLPSPTADLTAQTTLLKAETALLDAEIAKIEANKKKTELLDSTD